MSKTTVLPATKSSADAADFAGLGTKFFTLALESASEFIKQSSAFFTAANPSLQMSPSLGCCTIPQTECPPHCACEITWEASRGETLRLVLQVVNRSAETHDFTFRALPFSMGGKTIGAIRISPPSARLERGQATMVVGELVVSDAFERGATYHTEVLVTGAYEQRVCVTLAIETEQISHCVIEQGEPPMRVRAHEWYSHFQCSEPCFPARATNVINRGN